MGARLRTMFGMPPPAQANENNQSDNQNDILEEERPPDEPFFLGTPENDYSRQELDVYDEEYVVEDAEDESDGGDMYDDADEADHREVGTNAECSRED